MLVPYPSLDRQFCVCGCNSMVGHLPCVLKGFMKQESHLGRGKLNRENVPTTLACGQALEYFLDWWLDVAMRSKPVAHLHDLEFLSWLPSWWSVTYDYFILNQMPREKEKPMQKVYALSDSNCVPDAVGKGNATEKMKELWHLQARRSERVQRETNTYNVL